MALLRLVSGLFFVWGLRLKNFVYSYRVLSKLITANQGKGITRRDSRLVIEGYPRSGNSYSVNMFRILNPDIPQKSIAHHVHFPSQIIRAFYYNVPTLLIIREPKDAVISLHLRNPEISLLNGLKYYIYYHRAITPFLSFVEVVTFKEITSDFPMVVKNLNKRYGEEFKYRESNSEDFDKRKSNWIERTEKKARVNPLKSPLPTEERMKAKQIIAQSFDSPEISKYYRQAIDLYFNIRNNA